MLYKNKIYKSGFTVAELLIVIAVLSVLSAVFLFSMNGSRDKAINSKRLSTVGQYITALEMYRQDKGHYPIQTQIGGFCLGNEPSGKCGLNGGVSVNISFNNKLKPYISELTSLPNLKLTNPFNPNNISWDGAVYSCVTTACYKYQIEWFVKYTKSQSCGQGKVNTPAISKDTGCTYTSMKFN